MRISAHVRSQVVFYLGWVLMIVAEATIWSITGLVLGFWVFFIGGWLWGLWHIRNTDTGAPLHGPVLFFMDRILRKYRYASVFPAAFLGGGPGVALVLKKQGEANAAAYACVASAFYALLWCFIHAVRPTLGVPIEIWPSMHFLHNLLSAL